MEKLIDFSEPILRLVLPILLKDQTTGKNIIWATDPPPTWTADQWAKLRWSSLTEFG